MSVDCNGLEEEGWAKHPAPDGANDALIWRKAPAP